MSLSVLGLALFVIVTSDDLDNAFQTLKQAETQKDALQVKKSALEVFTLTRQLAATPVPEEAAQKEAWTTRLAYAREIETHAEYALSAVALQAPPAVMVDLLSTLEQQNPKSKYLDDTYGYYLYALSQTGGTTKIPAVAEKAIANFPENEDLLLVLADNAMSRKQSTAALGYSRRLVAVLNKHSKPAGLQAGDWQRKRDAALGRGYWIAGMVLSESNQYFEADRNLRAALPYVRGTQSMAAPALYYLGVANYQLGKQTLNKAQVLEGAKFSEESAMMPGPFAEHARRNALIMRAEAQKMR